MPVDPPPSEKLSLDDRARRRIRAWILSTGVTQTQLAAHIGRNQAWLSRYLSREFDADLDTLQRIARAFGHSIGALLDTPTDPDEASLIDAYRAMPIDARRVGLELFQKLARPRRKPRSR